MNTKNAPSTVLTFDIGGTRVKAGLVQGSQVSRLTIAPLDKYQGATDILEFLVKLGRQVCANTPVHAVGVSIKGIVDPQQGTILDVNESLSTLIGLPLASQLADTFQLPVFVENDARMYMLGELLHGAGQQVDNLLCLTLGTGIGSGVALGRHVLRGPRGVSGILGGHITIQTGGPRCTCGNIGCLEALIGTGALVATARAIYTQHDEPLPDGSLLTPQHIFASALAGSPAAQMVVHLFASYLGAGVVSLVHAYDPDLVVLGGGMAGASQQFLPIVQHYVDEHAWQLPRGRVRLTTAQLGNAAALIGIAALARGFDIFL
jgi:glucokinase